MSIFSELGEGGSLILKPNLINDKLIVKNSINNELPGQVVEIKSGKHTLEGRINSETGDIYIPKKNLPEEFKSNISNFKDFINQSDIREIGTLAKNDSSKPIHYNASVNGPLNVSSVSLDLKNKDYKALAKEIIEYPIEG